MPSSLKYYPAFLNLEGKKTVVVGGGKVAERKALMLIRAGADVTVIGPALTERLIKEKTEKRIRHRARPYRDGDLDGSFLVIAATDSPSLNREISSAAPALVNVVDVPAECNFIAPSVLQRGPLLIAVSTGGASPALARSLRKELEKAYGPEIGIYLGFLKKIRTGIMKKVTDKSKREELLKALGSKKMLKLLRSEGINETKKIARKMVEKSSD